ncbi:MAG: hypothetical protein ACOC38_10925 [Promethearchaeia archaeon]
MGRRFGFDELEDADLVIDASYEGGTKGNFSDDPLAKLLPCGNQGDSDTTRRERATTDSGTCIQHL